MIPKMDYVVITKNSETMLVETLRSIWKQGNVERIILVMSESASSSMKLFVKELILKKLVTNLLSSKYGSLHARLI